MGIAASTNAESLALVTTIIAIAPTNMKILRSAIEAEEPKVALSCVVSADRREAISPVFSASKKPGSSRVRWAKRSDAQVGDHLLAERHDEVVARPGGDREHDHDGEHAEEIDADHPGIGVREAEVHHAADGHRNDQRRGGGDDERDQRGGDAALVGEGVRQHRSQGAERGSGRPPTGFGGRRHEVYAAPGVFALYGPSLGRNQGRRAATDCIGGRHGARPGGGRSRGRGYASLSRALSGAARSRRLGQWPVLKSFQIEKDVK